ncbi:MAG: hypothetical protein Q8N08_00330 [Methanobacteriaceae archaeon]|nr:hypothetical protein [Methanobacteriaceae archaeon]
MKTQKSISLSLENIIAVQKIVKNGEYSSFSAYIRKAIQDKLEKDKKNE